MIVVDSNIVAYLYLPGMYTAKVEELLLHDPEWLVPPLWRSEFRNILAEYMRRGTLTFEKAYSIQHEAERLLLAGEHEVDSFDVLDLVKASECSAYDCEYIALAKKLATTLVTKDVKLLKQFPKYAVELGRFPS